MIFNLKCLNVGKHATGAIVLLFLASSQASAESWNLLDGDERLTAADLEEQLIGSELVFEGGERAMFTSDGNYQFHVGGEVYEYFYAFTDDGAVCITSPDFGSRCDLMVVNSGDLISINEAGDRYGAVIE